MTIPAFPLHWPQGWKRTTSSDRTTARFGKASRARAGGGWDNGRSLTISEAVARLRHQLELMGISDDDLVISSNLQLRLDGMPRSAQAEPSDPGIAVYWVDRLDRLRPPMCMAIDRYDRVADNLAAIAATLDAMRSIERHGGAEILNRAFTGFAAIEPPADAHWSEILGCERDASTADARLAYRAARSAAHPDKGGAPGQFDRVTRAWSQCCAEHGIQE